MRAVVSHPSPDGCRIWTVTTSALGSVLPCHMVTPRKSPFGSFVEKRALGVCFSDIIALPEGASSSIKLGWEGRRARFSRLAVSYLDRLRAQIGRASCRDS